MLKDMKEEKYISEEADKDFSSEQAARFQKQIEFILEADKLKHTLRRTVLMDRSRRENSGEHSWHIALTVLVLSEYAKDKDIDLLRVLKMLLVHDLVEIDAGDTYCYDDRGREDQTQREEIAADRIFNMLPEDQAVSLRALWNEFEARITSESRFANALDRLQPFLHNYFTEGQTWQENDVKSNQVLARMQPVEDGSPFLWKYVRARIDDAVEKGYLSE
jgi:putative hydrolase of HD superfamily